MNNKVYIVVFIFAVALLYTGRFSVPMLNIEKMRVGSTAKLQEEIVPSKGVRLPVVWGDLGVQMVRAGIIDAEKFENLYVSRGGLNEEMKKLLYDKNNGEVTITLENSEIMLNLLWALGLGNKNEIIEKGPMTDKRYGGAGKFASTGGWTLAKVDAMNHYSRHNLITLTPEQQRIVEEVSKNIYRPCCNNSTYFPDCNHGMAMLGLLELMASQGVSEEEMYRIALAVNSYWFSDTYIAIAQFLGMEGFDWQKAVPKDLLGYNFSSASGYQQILSELKPVDQGGSGGGSCGV